MSTTTNAAGSETTRRLTKEERYYMASQWVLMGRKLVRHKLALAGGLLLVVMYATAICAEFFAPYDPIQRRPDWPNHPPQRLRFIDQGRLHIVPFVYGTKQTLDLKKFQRVYTIDRGKKFALRLFAKGGEYSVLGLFKTDRHFFGVAEPGYIYLFGTDSLGRDILSRILHAARVSLSLGLVGVVISMVLGVLLGGISGYFGGRIDTIIQRIIEVLLSIPSVPLWMGLSAALPASWSALQVYFGIVIILSFLGWTGIARVVRGRFLQLREEDFVHAARVAGASDMRIIRRHLLPSFMSFIIVRATLAIPHMILGETSLSFLGLGLRPPVVSWGTLLRDAQNIRTAALYPWLLIPALFVILAVLAFNFFGDGLRDAADPYR